MGLVLSDILADRLEIEATVDGSEFLDWATLKYTAEVNKARSITFSIGGREALARLRVGGKVKIEAGRGNQITNLTFEGTVRSLRPGASISTATAIDYTSHLATSEFVEYKANQVLGRDLYYLAADAADYAGIDVTGLTEGSGLIATADMGLTGLMTRKTFIDRVFRLMYKSFSDSDHPTLSFVPWNYAIRTGKRMDFWVSDYTHEQAKSLTTVSETDDNITGEGIVGEIDMTRMVNTATYYNSDDETIYSTYTDSDSLERFGPMSKSVSFDSTSRTRLRELAMDEVERFKKPTISYTVQMHHGEWIGLGDLIKVKVPSLKREDILPVVRYEISIGEEITTALTLGATPLTLAEYIQLLG